MPRKIDEQRISTLSPHWARNKVSPDREHTHQQFKQARHRQDGVEVSNKSTRQCPSTAVVHGPCIASSPFGQPTAIAYSDMFQHVRRPDTLTTSTIYIYTKYRNWATYYRVRCRRCHIIHPPMYKVPHWSIKGEQTLHIIFQEFFPVTKLSVDYIIWHGNRIFIYQVVKKQKEYGRFFLYCSEKE
jgi:hypothetical protein